MSLATLLAIPLQMPTSREECTSWFPGQPPLQHPHPPWGPNDDTIHPIRWCFCHSQGTKLPGFWKSCPSRNRRTRCLLRDPWKRSVRSLHQRLKSSVAAWEDYFMMSCPHFNHETSHDLSCLFQDMITFANLLGLRFMTSKRPGKGRRTCSIPMMHWRLHQWACGSSASYQPQNHPRPWAWKAFLTWLPFIALLA